MYYTETSGNKIVLKVNAHTHIRFEAKKYIPDRVLPRIGITLIQGSNVYCIHSKWALLGSLVLQPCARGSMFFQISELRLRIRKLDNLSRMKISHLNLIYAISMPIFNICA